MKEPLDIESSPLLQDNKESGNEEAGKKVKSKLWPPSRGLTLVFCIYVVYAVAYRAVFFFSTFEAPREKPWALRAFSRRLQLSAKEAEELFLYVSCLGH